MAGFANTTELVDAVEGGKYRLNTWRKSPSQTNTARVWFDLSMSPGNPVPQYYAASPLVSVALAQSTDGGIPHGGNVSPLKKYVKRSSVLATVATGLGMPMILCDYLLFYPFIDEGTVDVQTLTNSVSLPRYTTGEGVMVMAVSVAGRTGGQTFQITYTNSAGTSGRTSSVVTENTAAANGSIVTSDGAVAGCIGAFIPLQAGDKGVRSIQSVQMISGTDVGLFCLVLVKPLMTTQIIGIDAPVEVEFGRDTAAMPQIVDDAYLNFICCPQGAINATALHGILETVWG